MKKTQDKDERENKNSKERKRRKQVKEEKKHIHTKISEKCYNSLKTLTISYGTMQNVIEKAIDLLYLKEATEKPQLMLNIEKSKLDLYRLSHLMFKEYNMMIVGRQTFLSYISNIPQEPIKKNNAIELIEWFYDNKYHISQLSLYQICYAIKQLWIAGNYFTSVIIQDSSMHYPEKELSDLKNNSDLSNANELRLIFSHDFTQENYGKYWVQYFKSVFENDLVHAQVKDIRIRHQSFSFVVKKKKFTPRFE